MKQGVSFRIKSNISEAEKIKQRQSLLQSKWKKADFPEFFSNNLPVENVGKKNCENLLGSVEIPVGVAGPVGIKPEGKKPEVEALIPLATTEGALVASVSRGCKIINESGGASVFVKKVGMSRAPVFRCVDSRSALKFSDWIDSNIKEIKDLAESTSSHLHYLSHQIWVRGNLVFARFSFNTQEAMGMNMVTIALQSAWSKLLEEKEELKNVEMISISGNVCADKKDSAVNRLLGRGFSVQAEVKIPILLIEEKLQVKAENLLEAHTVKNLVGSSVAGSSSQNMQVANVLAAVYLATGQDVAHVVEGAQAFTHLDIMDDYLLFSLNLPNINLGTIGGGTYLPAQTQARSLIFQDRDVNSFELAGVVGVAALAAEISGLAALRTGTLAKAHSQLAR